MKAVVAVTALFVVLVAVGILAFNVDSLHGPWILVVVGGGIVLLLALIATIRARADADS